MWEPDFHRAELVSRPCSQTPGCLEWEEAEVTPVSIAGRAMTARIRCQSLLLGLEDAVAG